MMESLSQMPGWALLKDDIQGWMTAISSGWASMTPETLKFEQGRYAGMKQVADHFQAMESIKAAILADELEDAA